MLVEKKRGILDSCLDGVGCNDGVMLHARFAAGIAGPRQGARTVSGPQGMGAVGGPNAASGPPPPAISNLTIRVADAAREVPFDR